MEKYWSYFQDKKGPPYEPEKMTRASPSVNLLKQHNSARLVANHPTGDDSSAEMDAACSLQYDAKARNYYAAFEVWRSDHGGQRGAENLWTKTGLLEQRKKIWGKNKNNFTTLFLVQRPPRRAEICCVWGGFWANMKPPTTQCWGVTVTETRNNTTLFKIHVLTTICSKHLCSNLVWV